MSKDSERGKYTSPEGSATWEYVATISCSALLICVGCVPGWNSPALAILMAPDSPTKLTASDASTLPAVVALGHMVAPLFVMLLVDKLGRKKTLIMTGIPMIISWALMGVTENVMVLFLARFIGGLGLGMGLCVPPMYLGEIASAKLRGRLAMVCGTMANVGILFMFVVVPYLTLEMTAYVCLTMVTLSTVSIWFIPESPYFLAKVDRIDKAEGVLEKLRGKTDVTEELELVKKTVHRKQKASKDANDEEDVAIPKKINAYKELFTVAGNRKALWINVLLVVTFQLGGYVSVIVYAELIIEAMKVEVSAVLCTTIIASTQLIFNVLTAFIVDKLGRKPLLCISGVISGTCVLIIGVYFYLLEYTDIDVSSYGMIAVCSLFTYVFAVNIGVVPLYSVIMSETLATDVKAVATSFLGTVGGVLAVIGVKAYLMIAVTWGHSVPFFGFTVITWSTTALTLLLLPETKGKTFYEIQQILNK